MARFASDPLDSGDLFPKLSLRTVDHGELELPGHFAGRFGVVLIYRAHW